MKLEYIIEGYVDEGLFISLVKLNTCYKRRYLGHS